MVSCGEASGDLYAGALVRELRAIDPGIQVRGLGGAQLAGAGGELIADYHRLAVTGLTEAIGKLPVFLTTIRSLVRSARAARPDALVAIDSPDFNFPLARRLKRLHIPVVYYISPQFWAWRPGRLKTIRDIADLVLVIFPFEEPLYQAVGVPCEFVGHPLLDEIPATLDREALRRRYEIPDDAVVVALLPGSRRMEIDRLLDGMAEAFRRIRADLPSVIGIMPVAPSLSMSEIRQKLSARADDLRLVAGDAPQVLACADFAVVASGTATLEAAVVGTPMVIVYKVAPLTMLLARLLVKIRSAGLVNILAGRIVAPELLQSNATPENIAAVVLDHVRNPAKMEEQKMALADVRQKLGLPGAARRAAASILKVLSQTTQPVTA